MSGSTAPRAGVPGDVYVDARPEGQRDSVSAAVFIALAVMTGTRFLRLRSVLDDKITFYYWYNVSKLPNRSFLPER